MILEGKKILITGVVNRHSIAFSIAERAQAQGAEVLLTSFGRVKRMTERSAARLDPAPEVLELDVNSDEDIAALRDELKERWGTVDGAVHAIAFAPGDAIGGEFMATPRESAKVAFETSAYSYKALAEAVAPLMTDGGALVGLDFDATVAWPSYDWMGVAKAALESVNRYLAKDLGAAGDPRQPDLGRPGPHRRRLRHLRLLRPRGPLGRRRPARLGPPRRDPGRRRGPVPAQRPLAARRPAKFSTSTAAPTPSERRPQQRVRGKRRVVGANCVRIRRGWPTPPHALITGWFAWKRFSRVVGRPSRPVGARPSPAGRRRAMSSVSSEKLR